MLACAFMRTAYSLQLLNCLFSNAASGIETLTYLKILLHLSVVVIHLLSFSPSEQACLVVN